MKSIIAILFTISLLTSCKKETIEPPIGSNFECIDKELEIIPDDDCCDVPSHPLICDVLVVEDVLKIDEENLTWLPNNCSELEREMVFTSSKGVTTFSLIDREHYIRHETVNVRCSLSHEHGSIIEQKYESIQHGYHNGLLSQDTIYLGLYTRILGYENQTLWPKKDYYRIYDGYASFVCSIGSTLDTSSPAFHESIQLNQKEYNSVIEFQVKENVNALPHIRYYANKEFGFFGIEIDQTIWTKI